MSEAVEAAETQVEDGEQAHEDSTDWKAEARKWESRAKANKDAAARLAEIEEANKTAEQKQAERVAALEAKVSEYEARDQVTAWASEIVKDSPVPASALRGSTEEELREHFAQLLSLIQAQPAAPVVRNAGDTPKESGLTTAELFAEAVADALI